MPFIIQAAPTIETALTDEEQGGGFIDLNEVGLHAKWACHGPHFAVAYERDSVEEVLAILNTERPQTLALSDLKREGSYGNLYFQPRTDGMHVEYWIEHLRGRELAEQGAGCADGAIEEALSNWLTAYSATVLAIVEERAGEMR